MISPEDGPRGASTEPKRLGLLVESEEAREGVPQFSDLRRLSCLEFCDHDALIFSQLATRAGADKFAARLSPNQH